jgi:LysR family nitrogen assimilation transcriptional regulator
MGKTPEWEPWEAAINFRQLAYFIKVVEAGNMTAAAELLKVAQPALGVQIRQLETELGIELLVRHSRGVTPTQAGKLLFDRAKRILDEVEATQRELRAMNAQTMDHVVLGMPLSVMMLLGPDILLDAKREIPHVSLSLVEERSAVLLEMMGKGQIDILFGWNVAERADLQRTALLEEDLLLVTTPDLAGGTGPVSFAEALRHELVIAGERGVIRNIVQGEARRLGLTMKVAYEVHSISSMTSLIGRASAATIMPYSLAPREIDSGSLVARRIERPAITRTLYLVRPLNGSSIRREAEIMAFLESLCHRALKAMDPYGRTLR